MKKLWQCNSYLDTIINPLLAKSKQGVSFFNKRIKKGW